ncbi:MAG: NUDIX domain-containing protein [Candidatus Wallbacteria bacterium]|nr:NUDIX domain-containing protein [Candidatus Wallbacteria bacterium]
MKRKVQVWAYRLVIGGGVEYLLLRRPRSRGNGWQPVTGGAKEGERLEAAARRELAEETGIGSLGSRATVGGRRRMSGEAYPLGLSYGFSYRGREVEETVFAQCVPEDSPIELSDEHVHAHWFDRQQVLARLEWDGHASALGLLDSALTSLAAGIEPSLAAPSGPAAALLDGGGRLVAWATLASDLAVSGWLPQGVSVVGVDAPQSLPFGMGRCCLEAEPRCECSEEVPPWGRAADRGLMELGVIRTVDRRGRRLRREWILRSLELADLLRLSRLRAIEVCAAAARRELLERPMGRVAFRGRLELQRALIGLVPGLPAPARDLLSQAELGAVLAAYTAREHALGRTRLLGDPAEGAIVMPA